MQWSKTRSVGILSLLKPWEEFQNFSDAARASRRGDLATCQYFELTSCHYPLETLTFPVLELSERAGFESIIIQKPTRHSLDFVGTYLHQDEHGTVGIMRTCWLSIMYQPFTFKDRPK